MVANSLADRYGDDGKDSGRAFLEKIIQVPLKLPMAMKEDLRSICFQQVEQAIAAARVELTEEEIGQFVSGFDRGISIRLDTPRAAKRYGNGLLFALPMLTGEINTVDLLLIEAVRAFYPKVYEVIRANQSEFSGVESEHLRGGGGRPRAAALLKPILDAAPAEEQESLKTLLMELFPRLSGAFGASKFGNDWLAPWARARRICSPDYCTRYFTYAVPKSDVRDSEVTELLAAAAAGDEALVRGRLKSYFTGGKARRVIERLRQQEQVAAPDVVAAICSGIAANAHYIPDPPARFRSAEAPSQAGILISNLIRRLPAGLARVAIAERVMAAADPLWFGAECLRWLRVTEDPGRADSNTLTDSELRHVREALVGRIKSRAAAGDLLFDVNVAQEQQLLYEWCRCEGREPVQRHLAARFKSDPTQIGRFLQSMAPQTWSGNDVMPRVGDLDANHMKLIKRFFDLDTLADLIRGNLTGNFEDPQWIEGGIRPVEQRLAEQFMFILKKWKRDGEPGDVA